MANERTTRHLNFHNTARAMAAMEVDYPHGSSTGFHAHPRHQLLHAIEGVMIVRSDTGSWVVPPNRAAWLVANLDHEVTMRGEVKIRTIFIEPAIAPHLPEANCVLAVTPLLRELLVAAVQIPLDYKVDHRDGRLMRLILDEIRVSDTLPLHLPLPTEVRIRAICQALIDNPSDASTATEWGIRLNLTAKTVHRLFAKETGMSFAHWREQARLLFALQRIADGDRIIDVAFDCGYASQSAFTAMFRRHFGIPPSTFYK